MKDETMINNVTFYFEYRYPLYEICKTGCIWFSNSKDYTR